VLVALGRHVPMTDEALARHLGYEPGRLAETDPGTTVVNHEWRKPETVIDLGTIPAARVAELSDGQSNPVLLNRAVVDHDIALVVGPVLPHEVVGISGGNKYFFPGACGQKIIDMSHWLGATITSAEIIGTTGITPVRALIDDSAALIPAEKLALCVVTAEVADAAADSGVDQTVPAAAAETPAGTNSSLRSVSFGAPQQDKPMSAELAHPTTVDTTVGTPESFALLVRARHTVLGTHRLALGLRLGASRRDLAPHWCRPPPRAAGSSSRPPPRRCR
jgi:Lactate racemase N-terminal domain